MKGRKEGRKAYSSGIFVDISCTINDLPAQLLKCCSNMNQNKTKQNKTKQTKQSNKKREELNEEDEREKPTTLR